jgi:transcriptional regulator with XRE-family HTH domain
MKKTFAERLRIFIETIYSDLSLNDVADKLGISNSTLSRYVTGNTTPSLENLEKICTLGISSDWLLMDKGSAFGGNKYGETAKEKFIDHIQLGNKIDSSSIISNREIIEEIDSRFGSKSKFYEYLYDCGVVFDESELDEFFTGAEVLNFKVEKVLSDINFYFFLKNKNHSKLQDFEYMYNNILQYDTTNKFTGRHVQKHKTAYKLLNRISSMITDYFFTND